MYATSRLGKEDGYSESNGQSTLPTEIGMTTPKEERKVEGKEANGYVLQAMGPSKTTNAVMRAREIDIGYTTMDEITQGTHQYSLRNSECYDSQR